MNLRATPTARRLVALALFAAGCARPPVVTAPSAGAAADTVRTDTISEGVTHRVIRSQKGPWTINVLEVDLDRCNAAEAVASTGSTIRATKTTELLAALAQREKVIGGVNGDFFAGDGRPTNLLVIDGRMVTPPIAYPVLAFDSTGAPHIGVFTLDHGALLPFHPLQAVGGRPTLVRDSAVVNGVDAFGRASFRERNPRTAAGIARDGKRLILAVVDGREYQNAGMTLRETADLMLALGAREAVNLDGGGSTTMVFADPDSSGKLRIANHPSDRGGERAVGDALAIVRRCP